MEINHQLVRVILAEIAQLEKEYQISQGMILSEDDLKCQLFSKLRNLLPQAEATLNVETLGSALHAEVKFFSEGGKLTLRPDISIINPLFLSIYHSVEFEIRRGMWRYNSYSSKNFEAGGSAIVIELKFCKDRNGIAESALASYLNDIRKIKRLQRIVHNSSRGYDRVYGIFAVFNKTDKGAEKLNRLIDQSEGIDFVYATGKVDFEGKNPQLFSTGFEIQRHQTC